MEFFASTATTGPAFCPHCGTILDHPDTNNIVCSSCEYRCTYENLPSLSVVTCSEEKPVPKWLKTEQSVNEVKGPARATVEETCPKCGNPEMDYYTMQLRSADEGQTVFYECKKCGHKFSVNN
ncbi:hypothetical protein PINS_up001137 [Pythium insidiosum]|uniref:DNA-directed RNA polymerase subunit n=1 Tax=Pythium insidiosum TaxID=114742 RepID=A0AAD5LT46_PYTIN|nr:hypothetical protein P43SY_003198 [Pythium insidiosum]GLD92578.1 hypothetical protein PINS_up001137 [Pythium insidiosum]